MLEYPLPSSIEKRWICSIVETSRGLLVCGMQGGSVVVLECKETEDSISFSFLKQVSPDDSTPLTARVRCCGSHHSLSLATCPVCFFSFSLFDTLPFSSPCKKLITTAHRSFFSQPLLFVFHHCCGRSPLCVLCLNHPLLCWAGCLSGCKPGRKPLSLHLLSQPNGEP